MTTGTRDKTSPPADDNGSTPPAIVQAAELPEILRGQIDLSMWANSLVNRSKYEEPDPDHLSRLLLMQTLTADTIDAVFEQGDIRKLQHSVPNVPGASTGPIEIRDLYVTGSDFKEGAPCYVILTCTDMETGAEAKYTTGAQQLQAQILRLVSLGVWPIKCKIIRTDRKDRGGLFLFWLAPADS
ncbi:MAG: hypothetical protein ACRD22_02760 [Terriglobia bacterium]